MLMTSSLTSVPSLPRIPVTLSATITELKLWLNNSFRKLNPDKTNKMGQKSAL